MAAFTREEASVASGEASVRTEGMSEFMDDPSIFSDVASVVSEDTSEWKEGASVSSDAASVFSGDASVRSDAAPVLPGALSVEKERASVETGGASLDSDATSDDSGGTSVHFAGKSGVAGEAPEREVDFCVDSVNGSEGLRGSPRKAPRRIRKIAFLLALPDEGREPALGAPERTSLSRKEGKAMSTSPKTNHRSLVSLHLPEPVPALLTYAAGIVTSMTGNPTFLSPVPSLVVVQAAVDSLGVAQIAALMRTRGAVATRDEKRVALVGVLQQLKAYIQAEADANVENGASIIASAGVAVRKPRVVTARVFAIKPGRVSGSIVIVAPTAARRASYEWESSTDGGKTWVELPPSLRATAELSGLVPGSTVMARYRSVTKIGPSDWSQPASFMVR